MLAHNKSLTNNCLIVSWPKSLLGFFCNILRKNLNFLANPISDYGKTWEAGRSIWHQMHLCTPLKGLPRWLSGEESAWQCRRHGFNPRVEKVPWRRKWLPTPVFLPGEFHEQRRLVGYSPWGPRELGMTGFFWSPKGVLQHREGKLSVCLIPKEDVSKIDAFPCIFEW